MSKKKPSNFIDRTGERRQNNAGDWMEIIECFGYDDNTVRFDDDGSIRTGVIYGNFKKGKVEHPVRFTESLYYNYPEIARAIAIPENNITLEDTEHMRCKVGKFYIKCPDCGKISSKKKFLRHLVDMKTSCEYCSDNISIPNKILRQISEQLNLNWEFEYSPEWLKIGNSQYSFDAYDDNLKIAIEADAHHKINNNHKGDRKEIDNLKDKLAKENNTIVIRIDLMNTKEYDNNKFEYIKQQYCLALNDNYNLNKLDWNKAFIESQKSLMIEACRLWEEEHIYSTIEIGKILKLSNPTIRRYLKKGKELELCDYTVEKSNKERSNKRRSINNNTSKLYWVIKPNGEKYSDVPLCGNEIYNKGFLKIGWSLFKRYISPYGYIDINRIVGENYQTKQTRDKLMLYNGWKFILLTQEEKQQYLKNK